MTNYYLTGTINHMTQDAAVEWAKKHPPAVARQMVSDPQTWTVINLSKTPIQPHQRPFVIMSGDWFSGDL